MIGTVDAPSAPPAARGQPAHYDSLVGESPEHKAAVEACAQLAHRGVRDVLLVGPPGSGKAHTARCMHNAGPRSAEAFLTIDCGALATAALEADFFGRVSGHPHRNALGREGLIQLAGAGTLFLRRVDLLPAEFQPRILGVLRDRVARPHGGDETFPVRCAFTASAGPALSEMVSEGRFDRALFEHLAVSLQVIPSLRERRSDIEVLARHFLHEASAELGDNGPPRGFTPQAVERMLKHRWPGNVRELRRAVQAAAEASTELEIGVAALKLKRDVSPRRSSAAQIHIPAGTGKTLAAIEAEAIEITLRQTGGNKSAAARVLGVSRPRLQRKIEKYGLESKPGSAP